MIVSLNEIEATSRKAALGAGVPIGVAEDFAQAMAWAAPLPVPIVALAVDALANLDAGLAARPRFERLGDRHVADRQHVSAIWLGLAAADLARSRSSFGLSCQTVDIPFLCAMIFAYLCSGEHCLSLRMSWTSAETMCAVVVSDGAVSIRAQSLKHLDARDRALDVGEPSPGDKAATLVSCDEMRRLKSVALRDGIEVEAPAWSRLGRFAVRMLVPATAQSRLLGAGAGDIDRA